LDGHAPPGRYHNPLALDPSLAVTGDFCAERVEVLLIRLEGRRLEGPRVRGQRAAAVVDVQLGIGRQPHRDVRWGRRVADEARVRGELRGLLPFFQFLQPVGNVLEGFAQVIRTGTWCSGPNRNCAPGATPATRTAPAARATVATPPPAAGTAETV